MKKVVLLLLFILFAAPAWAQEREAKEETGVTQVRAKKFDLKMKILDGTLRGSALWDLKTTYATKGYCVGGCKENTPYGGWFIEKGPIVATVAVMTFDTGVTALAMKMRRSDNPFIRHMWFAPHIGLIIGHSLAAHANSRIQPGVTAGLHK
jgi:hypothetical protein